MVQYGPLMVRLTEVLGAQRSKPSKSLSISSTLLMLTPDSHIFENRSSLSSVASSPYRVTLSKAVDSRLNGWSLAR